MFIRPALDPNGPEGARLKVRDPHSYAHLAEEGEQKPDDEYWRRRLVEGGVEEVEPPLIEGEPLQLTDEERAKLPPPGDASQDVEVAQGEAEVHEEAPQ